MTLKNSRTPLLCYFKLCAAFRSHWWIQTGVTVRKRPIWVKINDFFSRVTLKFDGWPSKTIGHLFYATSSFVQHFVAIGEFRLELQSGNAQSGSKSTNITRKLLSISFRFVLQNFTIPGHFPYILFYSCLFSLLSSGWFVIAVFKSEVTMFSVHFHRPATTNFASCQNRMIFGANNI